MDEQIWGSCSKPDPLQDEIIVPSLRSKETSKKRKQISYTSKFSSEEDSQSLLKRNMKSK